MAKRNGQIWKMVAVIVVVALAAGGWVWNAAIIYGSVSTNSTAIAEIKPEVHENTQGRIYVEQDIVYIKEYLREIKVAQKEIVEELKEIR